MTGIRDEPVARRYPPSYKRHLRLAVYRGILICRIIQRRDGYNLYTGFISVIASLYRRRRRRRRDLPSSIYRLLVY